jgi:hypothetical protein
MKPLKLAAILLLVTVAGVLIFLSTHYLANDYLNTHTAHPRSEISCEQYGRMHYVIIKNGVMAPSHIEASLCDTLTVTNEDAVMRDLAFGAHDHHQAYDGKTENMIKKGQSVTVALNKAGTFMFHDHLQDETKGTFTVNE